MNFLLLLLPALLAAALSFALTPLAKRIALAVGAIDRPGERKVHLSPIPRLGGLAVITPVVALLLILTQFEGMKTRTLHAELLLPLLVGLVPVFMISLLDDIRTLGSLPKFAAHGLGAAIAVGFGIRLGETVHVFGSEVHLGVLAIPLSILWIAGVTNAFNIVDGLDGLSAGLALISALSLAGVSILVGRYEMATAAAVLAGAIIGFLPYNTHPAKIFLGDTGSASIGFLLACLALAGGSKLSAGMAVLVPIVVLGVPIAETLVSMSRRMLMRVEGGEKGVFQADRRHFHHRLLDLGIDHRKAVLVLYGVGILLAICGFASMLMTTSNAAILLGTLVIAAFIGVGRLNYDEFSVVRRGTMLRVYDTPLLRNAFFAVFVDLALTVAATYFAIALKYDDWTIHLQRPLAINMLVAMPAAVLLVFWTFGIYRGSWKVASVQDFIRSSTATLTATVVAFAAIAIFLRTTPRFSFAIIFLLLFGLFVTAVRVSYRVLAHFNQRGANEGEPVLIYGAGVGGVMALRELLTNRANEMKPIGFIDDDERLIGRMVQGYRVYGTSEELLMIMRAERVRGVVVSSEKVPSERVAKMQQACDEAGIWLRRFNMTFTEYSDAEMIALNQRSEGWRLDVKKRAEIEN